MRFRKVLSVLALLILHGNNVAAHAHVHHHPPVITRTTRYIIIGVLVGGIILALILAFVGVLICQWIKRRKQPETTEEIIAPPGVTVVQVPANQELSQSNSQSCCSASMPSVQTQPQVIHVVQGAPPPNQGQTYPAQQYQQQPIQVQQYPPPPNQGQQYSQQPVQVQQYPPPQYQAPPNGPPPQQQPVQVVHV